MLELGPDNALDYLRSIGQVGPEPARVEALGWGVSNVVLRVETPDRRFVLKQSRPQLRTRDAWFSDLSRVYREQEVMQVLHPLLPPGVVPEVLFSDRSNYVFAMSHAPLEACVWKESLLAGEIDFALAESAGRVLGRMHEATARQRHLVEPFRDHSVFAQLRVDPFYRRVQERCPDVAEPVASLIEQLLTVQEALCHGDYSPKNILAHGGGFTLVDYETAHLGDPTMDLGFFLSHLMLKAIKRHAERERYFDLTRAFWRGYGSEVRFRSLPELMHRGIGHFGLCVLARIDGTSPVDYLAKEPLRNAARRLGRRVLRERPTDWEQVLALADPLLSL
ncbi:MAG: phosphotransferase [Planctomycetes bacterium]|nr:phosphotransferase [Planctomycetota bacterium]